MRPVSVISALSSVLLLAGCAGERLAASAPQGIDLSGEWNFDPNLSDDPGKLGGGDTDQTPQRTRHHGRGGGRGGGMLPPVGGPGGEYNYLPVVLTSEDSSAPRPSPETGAAVQSPPASPPLHGRSGAGHSLRAPTHLSITQRQGTVSIRADMTDGSRLVEAYKPGTSTTIPDGAGGMAKRTVGWRGPVFVISTDADKGGSREDDFALDDEGHLIMTTQAKDGHRGTVEIKRVYDRIRGQVG